MAQTGFTPIQIYSSSTVAAAPAAGNLTNSTLGSELAINITDGKLFYKDNANVIQVIGWKVTPATAGGTGQTSYAVGDLLYADTTTSLAKLADVATGNALISGGVGVAPAWGKIGLTTHVSGTLGVGNGGTGQASNLTQYGVIYGSTTTAMASTAAGTSTQVLHGNASGAPTWGAVSLTADITGTLGIGNGGTGLTTYTANRIPYASATNTLGTSASLTFDGSSFNSGYIGSNATQSTDGQIRISNNTSRAAGNKYGIRFADSGFETNGAIYVEQNSSGSNNATMFFVCNNSTGGIQITSGNVILKLNPGGTPAFPNHTTTASAANAYIDSATGELYRSTSSLMYKKDVEDLDPNKSSAIYKMRPIWYRSTLESDDPNWSWYGLGAEDVAQLEPRLVFWGYRDEDYDLVAVDDEQKNFQRVPKKDAAKVPVGVMYERLSVFLLKELQILKKDFEDYKANHP